MVPDGKNLEVSVPDTPLHQSPIDQVITRIGADVLLLLAALLFLSLFRWDWLGSGDGKVQNAIALASAAATFLAVAVALWSSDRAERLRRADERRLANLVAAEVAVTLRFTLERFDGEAVRMHFESVDDPWLDQEIGRVLRIFEDPLDRPTMDALRLLAPLPNNCAGRIARAYSELHYIKQSVAKEAMRLLGVGTDRGTRRHYLDYWSDWLSHAFDMLFLAEQECTKAADTGAPLPSDEEIFGSGPH